MVTIRKLLALLVGTVGVLVLLPALPFVGLAWVCKWLMEWLAPPRVVHESAVEPQPYDEDAYRAVVHNLSLAGVWTRELRRQVEKGGH